jgi:hypothetical protein
MTKQCVTPLEKINKVSRFIWHITPYSDLINLSIAEVGLTCPENYFVFAHNNLKLFRDSYPYFLDSYEFDTSLPVQSHFSRYSYWRIDTQLIDVEWNIDPYMVEDVSVYCSRQAKAENFICTKSAIPAQALALFDFDYDRFVDRPTRLSFFEGGFSAAPCRNDFDTLVYNKTINHFKERLANKNI